MVILMAILCWFQNDFKTVTIEIKIDVFVCSN